MLTKQKNNLAREKSVFFILISFGLGQLLLLILAARLLGPSRFGTLASFLSLATILLLIIFLVRSLIVKSATRSKKKAGVEKIPSLFLDLTRSSLILGVVAFLLNFFFLKFLLAKKPGLKKSFSFFFEPNESIIFLTLFLNLDLPLVKFLLPAETSGHYASLSLLGKIIFFFSWIIAGLIFSLLKEAKPKNRVFVLKRALILTFLMATTIVILYYLFPELITAIGPGFDYLTIIPYLGLFGLAMILFSLANLLIGYFTVSKSKKFLWLLVSAWLAQITAIFLWPQTILSTVAIMLLTGAWLFLNLLILFFAGQNQKAKS